MYTPVNRGMIKIVERYKRLWVILQFLIFFIPKARTLSLINNINGMFGDDLFQSEVFGDYMVNEYRDFKKKYNILWKIVNKPA